MDDYYTTMSYDDFFFFFQAEDGIRDIGVTGVQTCALPILQELVLAARHAKERLERIEAAIVEFLPQWSLAPVIEALQALRGIRLATAAAIVEIGRASGRGRVEIAGVAGSFKKQNA